MEGKKKGKKHFAAVGLAALLAFSSLAGYTSAGAAETGESTEESGSYLEDGTYAVPLTLSAREDYLYVLYTTDKYNTALLEVEDGEYTATIRVGNYMQYGEEDDKGARILKNDYVDVISGSSGQISSDIYNDGEYWRDDVSVFFDETLNYADITFTIDDPEEPVIIANRYTYPAGSEHSVYTVVKFNYSQALKLPEIKDGSYEWSYVLDNSFTNDIKNTTTGTTYTQSFYSVSTEIYELIEPDVEVTVEDGTATAVFTLTEYGQSLERDIVEIAWQNTHCINGSVSNNRGYGTGIWSDFTGINVDGEGKFSLEFDLTDYKDMVFGHVARVYYANVDENYDTYIFGTLRLAEEDVRSITLEDGETGIRYQTTTAYVSETDSLRVTELTAEDEGYSSFEDEFEYSTTAWTAYDISVVSEDGTEKTMTTGGTLQIPVPEGGSEDSSYLAYMDNGTSGTIRRRTGSSFGYLEIESSLDRPYAVITSDLGYEATAEDLEDGVYEVSWYIKQYGGDSNSMADRAFAKPGRLVVKDGTVRLEVEQQGVAIGSFSGTLSRGYVIDDETGGEPFVTTSYLKNDDGTYYDLGFYAGRTLYYPLSPETLYLELEQDHNGLYELEFRIPVMDGLNDVEDGYIGMADKTAWLIIDYTTAEQILDGDGVPVEPEDAPIDEALTAAMETLEYLSSYWPEISPEAWDQVDVEGLLAAAETASAGTADDMKAAWRQIQDAIDLLTDSYLTSTAYDDTGIYTADASLADDADGRAAVTEARFRVDSDNRIHVTLETDGMDAFRYYDMGERSFADADTLYDSEGNITGFTFVLPERSSEEWMYTEMGVSYLVSGAGDDAGYTETWLSLTETAHAGEIPDRSGLEALLETAAARIAEGSGTEALEDAVAAAQAVYDNPTAFQTELDEQAAALEAALGASGGDAGQEDSTDKDALAGLASEVEGLLASGTYDDCTQETRDLLTASVEAAKAVLEDGTATQADVDAHYRMVEDAEAAMLEEQSGLADGIYEVSVNTWQAADPTASSMSDAAIADSWVVVENGEPAYLGLEFQPLTTSLGTVSLTGYLESIGYYAGYHSTAIPSGLTPVAAAVESRFTDEEIAATYDYNNGEDPFAGYKNSSENYPKTILIPIESDGEGGYYTEYWIQVYVPVMASISASSGTQNARLVINIDSWDDMTQISGAYDTDKTALQAEVDAASALLEEVSGGNWRSEDVAVLEAAISAGNAFLGSMNIDQTMTDSMTAAVGSARNLFAADTGDDDDTGEGGEGGTGVSTGDTGNTGSGDGDTGEGEGTGEGDGTEAGEGGTGVSTGDTGNTGSGDSDTGSSILDIYNLEDGVYILQGEMVKAAGAKTSGEEYSMANEAINHTIVLTVENGKYYLTIDFKGMTIGSDFGYLGQLKYFLTGYTVNDYGVPQGDLADATVITWQVNEDGTLVSDSFGTDYPDYVTFELIPEALEDGYVPLQVFVPIMESISSGLGTQAVYLKLDWSTLEVSGDDAEEDIFGGGDPEPDDNGGTTGEGEAAGSLPAAGDNPSLTGSGNLGTASLGGSSLDAADSGSSGLSSVSGAQTGDTAGNAGGFLALLAVGAAALAAGLAERRMRKKNMHRI